jgi:homoaconitase/3-isopropylmalate dehydratase large subunit
VPQIVSFQGHSRGLLESTISSSHGQLTQNVLHVQAGCENQHIHQQECHQQMAKYMMAKYKQETIEQMLRPDEIEVLKRAVRFGIEDGVIKPDEVTMDISETPPS